MNKIMQILLAGVLAIFVSGTAAPVITPVYAAEQTADQDQQSPPSDASQGDHNEHAGHHG